MTTAAGRGLVGILAVTLLVAAGCGEDSELSGGSEPIRAPGIVSAPRRPIIVQPLPSGWTVTSVPAPQPMEGPLAMQTLYLPPGSTPEQGPALAVGLHGRDYGEALCGFGREVKIAGSPGGFAGGRYLRSGSLSSIEAEVRTEQPAFVFGRDVTEAQLTAAAAAAQFPEEGFAEIASAGLPSDFRRVASAPVIPNVEFGQIIELRDEQGTKSITLGAYEGDAASDMLTQFWNATVVPEPCESYEHRKAHGTVDGTDVYVSGNASQALVDQVAANVTATDQAGFEAFRAQTASQSAAALLHGCERGAPGPSVIVDGTEGKLRWALAMYWDGSTRRTCSAMAYDGQAEGGGSSAGSTPAVSGAGSSGVVVLENATGSSAQTGSSHLIGGTVPVAATRVVISDAQRSTDAKLVPGGNDPTRQYFGGALFPSTSLAASVVAYDAAGTEIGRYNTP